jgi:hypothetical protein
MEEGKDVNRSESGRGWLEIDGNGILMPLERFKAKTGDGWLSSACIVTHSSFGSRTHSQNHDREMKYKGSLDLDFKLVHRKKRMTIPYASTVGARQRDPAGEMWEKQAFCHKSAWCTASDGGLEIMVSASRRPAMKRYE